MTRVPGLAVLLTLAALPALAEMPVKEMKMGSDTILTDAKGMTLYSFDADKNGMSACYGACATNWPPLLAGADAKGDEDFGLTKRNDGTMQWTYYGMPLYLWVKDAKPGDTTGDGVKGVWHIVKVRE